ncbi:hypothetical protein KW533_04205 [Vibrio fluvialis]|nr:hypothetical protein [Vibrio fluvialis]
MKIPDPFHLLILIVTFLASVVLGGLIVGGIVAASLALRPFDSQWVSAFGTVLAAVGTVFTLCFLIYQNASQAKEIKNERAKREAHEDEQKQMWKEQREMLVFQKLQTHKGMFNDLLNEIEHDLNVKFEDRLGLYRKIFPNNDLALFDITTISKDTNRSHLIESGALFTKISKYEKSEILQADKLLIDLLNLSSHLHLSFPNNNYFGDITTGDDISPIVIVNIFALSETISIYQQVFEKLYDFCGMRLDYVITHYNFHNNPLFDNVFALDDLPGFEIHWGNLKLITRHLYNVTKNVDRRSPTYHEDMYEEVRQAEELFENRLRNKTTEEALEEISCAVDDLYSATLDACDADFIDRNRKKALNDLRVAISHLECLN